MLRNNPFLSFAVKANLQTFIVFHARIPLQIPFESSRIGDHTTDGTAVAVDVFGCGIDYDVCAKFERTNKKRGSYRIIDHEWKIVPLCDPCKCRDVGHIQLWIANRLREDDSRLIRDLGFEIFQIIRICKIVVIPNASRSW